MKIHISYTTGFQYRLESVLHGTRLCRLYGICNDIKTAEDDKKYFCGWRNNGKSGNVTDKNYNKTKRIVDETVALELRSKNVSSKWTSFEKDEDLARINEFTCYLD